MIRTWLFRLSRSYRARCIRRRLMGAACMLILAAIGRGESLPASESARPTTVPLSWKLSGAALAAGQALDSYSSRGRVEMNPLLRASDGTYSEPKGIAVKAGLVVGISLAEHLMLRHHPQMARPFTWINFALAGASGAVAAHNWEVK